MKVGVVLLGDVIENADGSPQGPEIRYFDEPAHSMAESNVLPTFAFESNESAETVVGVECDGSGNGAS